MFFERNPLNVILWMLSSKRNSRALIRSKTSQNQRRMQGAATAANAAPELVSINFQS